MTNFLLSKLTYEIYRYDNGFYCARFTYPDDNGDILSVNFEFNDAFYRDHQESCLWFTEDTFKSYDFELIFKSSPTDSQPFRYVVDLPTIFGYRSRRFKWLRSGTHHTRLFIDFERLFAF